ncbi:multi-sensor hybrid histidine kinase [Pseudogulbenkiania sp. NH8B]|uniref:CHASE domain-containing protein n=1 Tax=Pseudogulbenkiania sp. (strain NH8B) TaxID=748280 RepID=UPI000227A69F|nr:CHASE domain-containing protein [Pseudogulbenkiania sp. NH8B]BAK78358.1 multi-sensor hybrid histidine kinase [Pseudogulbenkiania sp. NH8B]
MPFPKRLTGLLPDPGMLRGILLPVALLFFLTAGSSLLVANLIAHQDDNLARQRFDHQAGQVEAAINERMQSYHLVLHGVVGLFQASGDVSRQEFNDYLATLQLSQHYPGLASLGYVDRLAPAELPSYLSRMQQERPDFRLHPDSPRAGYTAIRYLYPPTPRNETALGFDMYTETTRRNAMIQALDSGAPAVTGKVAPLLQSTPKDTNVFLMYWPVYRKGAAQGSVEARRAALQGWVFATFRMGDLMLGIFGDGTPQLNLRIYDGNEATPASLMYSTGRQNTGRYHVQRHYRLGGRPWLLDIASAPELDRSVASTRYLWVMGLGLLASLLLSVFIGSILFARRREAAISDASAAAAKKREEHFRAVIQSAPNAMLAVDQQGFITMSNPAAVRYFGYSPEELQGKSIEMLLPERFRKHHPMLRQAFKADSKPRQMGEGRELFALCKDGREIPVEIGLSTMLTEEGVQTVCSIIDISERKLSELRLREQAEQISRANRYKTEFLATMSHELRTPLNSILILADQLAENRQGNLTAKQVEHATIINRSGKDLLALINDILDLSKIEAGRMTLNREKVLVNDLITTLRQNFLPVAENRQLTFQTTKEDSAGDVLITDATRLFQILKNLLSNAFKFTDHGSVHLRVYQPQSVPPGMDSLPQHTLAIAVTDTGCGMPSDKLDRIFEAFEQLEQGSKRQFGGSGLGLSISRQLAHLLGGTIDVRSELGLGSTFVLYLPVHPAGGGVKEVTLPPEPHVVIPPAKASSRSDVLVVEDDQQFARIIMNKAMESGFKTRIASTGIEALQEMRQHPPAAFILDILLPDMNGWELLRQVRGTPATRHAPVHIISCLDRSELHEQLDIQDYLVKPVDQSTLARVFRELHAELGHRPGQVLLVEDNLVEREHYQALIEQLGGTPQCCGNVLEAKNLLLQQTFACAVIDLNLPGGSGFELLQWISSQPGLSQLRIIINTGMDLDRDTLQAMNEYSAVVLTKGAANELKLSYAIRTFLDQVSDPAGKAAAGNTANRERATLLLVDDDIRNIYAMSSVLEERQFNVLTAINGEEALTQIEQNPGIQLVLMDMAMPVLDGYETTRRLRSELRFERPIIAVTAYAMKDDKAKCLQAGTNDYLPKPVDSKELLRMIDQWLTQT